MRDGQHQLRNLFKTEFAHTYGTQYEDNKTSGQFFLSKVTDQNSDKQVVATIRSGDSAHFNYPILLYCLLYSGALLQRNKSETREQINALKKQRKLIAMSSDCKLSQQDFNTRITELTAIYQQMGWSCTELTQAANNSVNIQLAVEGMSKHIHMSELLMCFY